MQGEDRHWEVFFFASGACNVITFVVCFVYRAAACEHVCFDPYDGVIGVTKLLSGLISVLEHVLGCSVGSSDSFSG